MLSHTIQTRQIEKIKPKPKSILCKPRLIMTGKKLRIKLIENIKDDQGKINRLNIIKQTYF